MADSEKKDKVPDAPEQLKEEARPLYNSIYNELIKEGRGKEKFRYTVAVAANALYFYKVVMSATVISETTDVEEIGLSIRALNSASMEWSRASKALLLTPESESKMKEVPVEEIEKPKTFEEMLATEVNAKYKGNYGGRPEVTDRKMTEKSQRKKRAAS